MTRWTGDGTGLDRRGFIQMAALVHSAASFSPCSGNICRTAAVTDRGSKIGKPSKAIAWIFGAPAAGRVKAARTAPAAAVPRNRRRAKIGAAMARSGSRQPNVDFPFHEAPLPRRPQLSQYLIERAGIGRGVIEEAQEIERLVRAEIPAMQQAAGDGRQIAQADRDMMRLFFEDGAPLMRIKADRVASARPIGACFAISAAFSGRVVYRSFVATP